MNLVPKEKGSRMIDLSSGLEQGVVATGLGVMLALAVWLFFRRETHGMKSKFLKRIDPFDDEIKQCSTVLHAPSDIGNSHGPRYIFWNVRPRDSHKVWVNRSMFNKKGVKP